MKYLNNIINNHKAKKILLVGSPRTYPSEIKFTDPSYLDTESICSNFRQPSLHGKFDVVFICDPQIFKPVHWENILDEIIRFTKNCATLIIHAGSIHNASVWGIKSFISDKLNLNSKLISQDIISINESFFEIEIKRERFISKNWCIGIPTNGKKNVSILALLNSIQIAQNFLLQKAKVEIDIEIIIVGKKDKLFDGYDIRLFEQSLDENLPALGEKKYIIGNNATYENILFIHDRYTLDKSFFLGFEKWGYDFEYATTQQYDTKHNIYDPILAIDNFNRANIQMRRINNQSYPYNMLYVNGGLTIVKKSIIRKINFNPFLMHCEAEDIDFARRLNVSGIIPRFNPYSVAFTSTDIDQSNLATLPKL